MFVFQCVNKLLTVLKEKLHTSRDKSKKLVYFSEIVNFYTIVIQ